MKNLRGLGFLIFLAVFALSVLVVMLLWNCVVVNVFAVGPLTYWYAAGLLVLSKILLGGWMHHGHNHFHAHRDRFRGGRHHNRGEDCCDPDEIRQMHEKFHSMSRAERKEYIRNHMAGRPHGGGFHGGWHGRGGRDEDPAGANQAGEGPGSDER